MPKETTIHYDGELIASFYAGQTATLKTKGDELEHDIVVTAGSVPTPQPESEWFNDGNTHLWVSLPEGRTSPMVGVCPNGTVTVDWGDGTAPDVLTGTSTEEFKETPVHHYASAGDYVITLTVDGEIGLGVKPRYNGSTILQGGVNDGMPYRVTLKRLEIGNNVTSISSIALLGCVALTSISINNNSILWT